ncbi:MAG: hypothetical protein A2V66_05635 [Ignavibacteria bacterium RBG_13_36_8]|nr:MAG: hypothetical protein A2V66_05635 [Ignavibacteria bacterium RBG_13_36_8]
MGQVPATNEIPYLIVGNGRLAKHIIHYFQLLRIRFGHWHRHLPVLFDDAIGSVSKILLLIPDGAIEEFIQQYKSHTSNNITWIHCSGALSTPNAESAHPLMTFTHELYNKETYTNIPFITEEGRKTFIELFPELPNNSYMVPEELKTLYHAWCTMAGNFTSLLWSEFFKRLENDFNIPKESAYPFLKQISSNIVTHVDPVTGPLSRGDYHTVKKHIESLTEDEFIEIYKAFVEVFERKQNKRQSK